MSLSLTQQSLLTVALASSLACACSRPQPAGTPVVAPAAEHGDAESVVARIGSNEIRLKDLDEHIGAQLKELEEQQFEVRRQGLDQMIDQQLIKQAAFKKGKTEEQFVKEMADSGVKPPSEAEVKGFFEQNASQLPPGAKLDDFKDKIRNFLLRQAQTERAKAAIAELRKAEHVEVLLVAPPKPRLNVEPKGPSTGPDDAKVTIVEFSDFECPFCSRGKDSLDKIMAKYKGKLKVVFRQFPLSFHQHAHKAAEASLCAADQNKFWPYYDALFADQKKLSDADLKETASKLGLDKDAFGKCLDSNSHAQDVDDDVAAGTKLGVTGTPAFFINGMLLSGAQPPDAFVTLIDQELAAP